MRDAAKYAIAAIAGSIILGAPAVAVEKITAGGDVVEAIVKEGGGAINAGMNEVQNVGQPTPGDPAAPTTTAPDVGSGRG